MKNSTDITQRSQLGISEIDFEKQLFQFREGIDAIKLLKPSTIGDGIQSYDAESSEKLRNLFIRFRESLDIVKFVPASGAATRMFKDLFLALEEIQEGKELNAVAKKYLDNVSKFAFYPELKKILQSGSDQDIIEKTLLAEGLNYGSLPKALIAFHADETSNKKAVEEHFLETISYAHSDGVGRIHFTVSKDHLELLKKVCAQLKDKYTKDLKFQVEFSTQEESTNTVAVYLDNEPVRLENGELMYRPAGHGALLNNLNGIQAQLIFIKNIDNVSLSKWHEKNAAYKELLAGRLLDMRENIHSLLNGLIHESGIKKASKVIYERWGIEVNSEEEIINILDRPIRVCGMVKNTGAPGGGPFWVEEEDGSRSAHIVESSQVDLSDQAQKDIWLNSTHFNPVDIVCWVENHSGEKFDLLNYRDDNTGFISTKSFQGKDIKALELPGLWNGSMAGWITEFVEVPQHTFNPVKTVLDLLNEGHSTQN